MALILIIVRTDVRIIDSLSGKLIQVFRNLFSVTENPELTSNELSCFCFDERQRKLIVGDIGGGIRVYNLSNGELIEEIQKPGEIGNDISGKYEPRDPYKRFLMR